MNDIEVGINVCLMWHKVDDIQANIFKLDDAFPFDVSILFAKFVEAGRSLGNLSPGLSSEQLNSVLPKLTQQIPGSKWLPTLPVKRASCDLQCICEGNCHMPLLNRVD